MNEVHFLFINNEKKIRIRSVNYIRRKLTFTVSSTLIYLFFFIKLININAFKKQQTIFIEKYRSIIGGLVVPTYYSKKLSIVLERG